MLQAKLNGLDRENGPWEPIEREFVAWRDETKAILPEEYRALFESSAGMMGFGSYVEHSRLSNYINHRLARLGEIVGKL